MTEINGNKPEIKISQSVIKAPKVDAKADVVKSEDIAKDYKEAADNRGAEAAGRAMVNLSVKNAGKVDNIENDIKKILDNPKLLDQSEVLFKTAEKAGVPYPQAASFATSELG